MRFFANSPPLKRDFSDKSGIFCLYPFDFCPRRTHSFTERLGERWRRACCFSAGDTFFVKIDKGACFPSAKTPCKALFAQRENRPKAVSLRLSKKPVIASQSADWRGNPFSKHMIFRFSIDLQLKDYGFPRRFAPRSKYPWGAPRNDRRRK